eukprot:12390729-Alexandrium_andersonii.AAC.1
MPNLPRRAYRLQQTPANHPRLASACSKPWQTLALQKHGDHMPGTKEVCLLGSEIWTVQSCALCRGR